MHNYTIAKQKIIFLLLDICRSLKYVSLFSRPMEYLICSDPEDLNGNETKKQEQGYGCTKVEMLHSSFCQNNTKYTLPYINSCQVMCQLFVITSSPLCK